MNKRLLQKDYENIIIEAFKNPSIDWYNYYLNVTEAHHEHNEGEFFERLTSVLQRWIEWYKSKVYSSKRLTHKFNDGKTRTINANARWSDNEDGSPDFLDIEKTLIPDLRTTLQINTHVDRAFFDKQLDILDTIKKQIEIKQQLIAWENELPEDIREVFRKNPMREGIVSIKELQDRLETHKTLPDFMKYYRDLLAEKINEYKPQFDFANIFDDVPPEKVYEYFYSKLVEGKFISKEKLQEYLILAFEKETIPTEKFTFFRDQTKTNDKIRKIFYKYWNELAGHQHGTKDRYVKLYCDYFNGFKFGSEKTNFSK